MRHLSQSFARKRAVQIVLLVLVAGLWPVGCKDGGKEFRRVLRSAARDAHQSNPKQKGPRGENGEAGARGSLAAAASSSPDAIAGCPKGSRLNGAAPPRGISQWCSAVTKDGKDVRHGEYRRWHKNGKLKTQASYQYGKYHGTIKEWFPNGNPAEETSYHDGEKHGVSTVWNRNGSKRSQGEFVSGRRNGPFKFWSRKGKLEREGIYAEDVENGLWTYYHQNGNLKARVHFVEGKKHGRVESFSQDGTILTQETYRADVPEGLAVSYYTNGNRKSTGAYAGGQKHGQWTEYGRDGEVRNIVLYHQGGIVKSQGPRARGNDRIAKKGKRSKRLRGHTKFRNGDVLGAEPPIPDDLPVTDTRQILPEPASEEPRPVDKGRGWKKL